MAAPVKRGVRGVAIFSLTVGILMALGFWWWRSTPANIALGIAPGKVAFEKLKGQWRRPDGGYILAIKNIADSGTMEAAYFNPGPIHVARAEASREGDATKVFVELRDVNYPGSTYTLTYEPSSDLLRGVYYQAVERQRYEVVFVRIK